MWRLRGIISCIFVRIPRNFVPDALLYPYIRHLCFSTNPLRKSLFTNQDLCARGKRISRELLIHGYSKPKYIDCLSLIFTGYQSAFTFKDPTAGYISGYITFSKIISTIGSHYNQTTGSYTCAYNGTYLFTLKIYKSSTAFAAYCWIRKNRSKVLPAM